MFCSKCGAKGNKENQFCQDCGNQLNTVKKDQGTAKQQESKVEPQTMTKDPEWVNTAEDVMNPTSQTVNVEQKKQKIDMKNPRVPIIIAGFLVIIVAIILVVDLPSGLRDGGTSGVGEVGFDTPEEALIFYLEGLRDSNLDQMVSAFAIETFVENFDLEAKIERMRSYQPPMLMEVAMPNTNDFIVSMSVENRRGKIVSSIILQYFALSHPDLDMSMSHRKEEGEARDFVNQLEEYLGAPDLQALEIIGFIMPEDLNERYLALDNQSIMARGAEIRGADEIVSRVIVFQIGRDQYLLFADLINYDGEWHILNFQGNIGVLVNISHTRSGLISPEYMEWYLRDIDSIDDLIIPIE